MLTSLSQQQLCCRARRQPQSTLQQSSFRFLRGPSWSFLLWRSNRSSNTRWPTFEWLLFQRARANAPRPRMWCKKLKLNSFLTSTYRADSMRRNYTQEVRDEITCQVIACQKQTCQDICTIKQRLQNVLGGLLGVSNCLIALREVDSVRQMCHWTVHICRYCHGRRVLLQVEEHLFARWFLHHRIELHHVNSMNGLLE